MGRGLAELLAVQRRPRLLVVGDLMLDRYTWADWSRMSPEAPVPVLQPSRREDRLGGAGSVAAMAAGLEAEVCLVSVVGGDRPGRQLLSLLEQAQIDTQAVFLVPERRTTVKHRLWGSSVGRPPQALVRLDREQTGPIDAATANRLLEAVWQRLDWADCILLSDYGKGVCSGGMVPQLVAVARSAGVPVLADPARSADYRRYAGCRCLLPNRLEAGLALGMRIARVSEGLRAAERLLEFGVSAAGVKLDRDGIAWAEVGQPPRHFPAWPREVHDPTGAGDMVLAALGFAMAAGADWPTGLQLANLAAGLEVSRIGSAPIHPAELRRELARLGDPEAARAKVVSLDRLVCELQYHRAEGRRVVLTNGCFDLLHPGHLCTLTFARSQGDLLVVAVNSDRSVRQLKGPCRPIIPQPDRVQMLAALACVDYVVVFDSLSVLPVIERIRPDVLVKGGKEDLARVVGAELVTSYGGRVVLAPTADGYSTTGLITELGHRSALGISSASS